MRVGVLALQGNVREHLRAIAALGAEAVAVKRPEDLTTLQGLILPGGESTTIGMLMEEYGFFEPLRRLDLPLFGTCAGLILLARDIEGSRQPRIGLLDVTVRRNAFGRQRESFEAPLSIAEMDGPPVPAVFIRAPYVTAAGPQVEVLARVGEHPVLVRQGRLLGASFHPEMTDDVRIHALFLHLIRSRQSA